MSKQSEQLAELSANVERVEGELTELKSNVAQIAANNEGLGSRHRAELDELEAKLRLELGEPDADLSEIVSRLKATADEFDSQNSALAGIGSGASSAESGKSGSSESGEPGAPGDGSTSGAQASESMTQPTDFSDTEKGDDSNVPKETGESSSDSQSIFAASDESE